MNFEGKIALVTGASRGIGRAIAETLAARGAKVIGTATSENGAQAISDYLGANGKGLMLNVTDPASIESVLEKIRAEFGEVDILVNNAAIDLSNLFHLKNAEEFRRTMDVNVVGAFNCSKRVYRRMLEKEYGRIINISSTNGINTYYPMCIDYDASKAALISLTHNLAFEFAPYIHVNCIAPGFIGTENELDGYDEAFLEEEIEKIMVGRYGDPREVAYLVKFLISDEANFINNTVIRIDGGQKGSC